MRYLLILLSLLFVSCNDFFLFKGTSAEIGNQYETGEFVGDLNYRARVFNVNDEYISEEENINANTKLYGTNNDYKFKLQYMRDSKNPLCRANEKIVIKLLNNNKLSVNYKFYNENANCTISNLSVYSLNDTSSTCATSRINSNNSRIVISLEDCRLNYYSGSAPNGSYLLLSKLNIDILRSSPELGPVVPLPQEIFYVRSDGGTYGMGNGTSWNNAFSGLPSETDPVWGTGPGKLGGGDLVYVAGGTYSNEWAIGEGGSNEGSRLIIKRATVNENRFDNGWNNSFDSQIILGLHITINNQNYITIDGSSPNGIVIRGAAGVGGHKIQLSPGNNLPSNYIVLRNIEVDGTGSAAGVRGIQSTPVPFTSNLVLENINIHNIPDVSLYVRGRDTIIQNSIIHDSGSYCFDTYESTGIFRWNRLYNCNTGSIFLRNAITWSLYGNLIYYLSSYTGGNDGIVMDSNAQNNIQIYNNTIFNTTYPIKISDFNSSGRIMNNILHGSLIGLNSMDHTYNWYGGTLSVVEAGGIISSENPLQNVDAHDLKIRTDINSADTPIDKGINLGFPFDMAVDSALRPNLGNWDIGAYEQN